MSDWWHDQDVKVLATGSSPTNCENRRDHITWKNFSGFARLRDSEVTDWCASRITG